MRIRLPCNPILNYAIIHHCLNMLQHHGVSRTGSYVCSYCVIFFYVQCAELKIIISSIFNIISLTLSIDNWCPNSINPNAKQSDMMQRYRIPTLLQPHWWPTCTKSVPKNRWPIKLASLGHDLTNQGFSHAFYPPFESLWCTKFSHKTSVQHQVCEWNDVDSHCIKYTYLMKQNKQNQKKQKTTTNKKEQKTTTNKQRAEKKEIRGGGGATCSKN